MNLEVKTDLFDEAKKMFLDQLTESVATTNADQHALLIIQREEKRTTPRA